MYRWVDRIADKTSTLYNPFVNLVGLKADRFQVRILKKGSLILINQRTSRAASMLNLRRSASVPVTVEPPRLTAVFFFNVELDIGAFGVART